MAQQLPEPAPGDAGPDSGTPSSSPFHGFGKVAATFGQFVAPTTLLTALLFYFGWNHVYWFFRHFGVESATLHPSITDYLMRSVDALFVPLIVAGVICMGLTWGYLALPESVRGAPPSRWFLRALTAVAVLVLAFGLSRLFFVFPLNNMLGAAPLSVIAGVGLLWYVVLQRRQQLRDRDPEAPPRSEAAAVIEWTILFVVVGISLFWIATDYSAAVGSSRAQLSTAEIPYSPGVVVYSEKDLHLSSADVRKVACDPVENSGYRFRYDGLVMLTHIGDQYVLLPRNWPTHRGAAIVLPASAPGAIRFEFRLSDNPVGARC